MFFGRDSRRIVSDEDNIIVSPADDWIIQLSKDKNYFKIVIHLFLLDVHTQRIPLSSVVKSIEKREDSLL